jgi:N-acetylmuramoyl-L-alanine amidase
MSYFILAGHCADKKSPDYDPGACANGVTEADLAKELRDLTVAHFPKGEVKIDDDRDSLKVVIQKLKSVDSDIICDIHFNAAAAVSATGVEVITPFRATDKELKLAKEISTKFAKIMAIKNRGVKDETQTARKRLGIMQPKGINILIEVCFITNPKDLAAYQTNKEALALSLYNSLKAVL